ncbi:MAG: cobalt-precorrin-6A reductase [Cyanobacteriota bacterium]|nr:cobalt-precorrin-6A reductase [Cyanobacteriota bacterium]
MLDRIWLIGGTRESREIATALAEHRIPIAISVTTQTARSLYSESPYLNIRVGKLDRDSIEQFLRQERIRGILDASHPYAMAVSELATTAAEEYQLPYLRFERPALEDEEHVLHLPSFNDLLGGDDLRSERVLLVVGYQILPRFQPWQERSTLFARLLPSQIALETALAAGFTPDRLIALRPPVSAELEAALWRQWQITMVVAKASGKAGGEDVKRQVAAELGVKLVIIDRPVLSYPQQTSDIAEAVTFCLRNVASN